MKNSQPVSRVGIIGLGTMGSALAQNFASHSIHTSIYNRTYKKTKNFVKIHGSEFFIPTKKLKEFVESLKRPRSILIMVSAGHAVDAVIDELLPYLQKGDILIDGGNSYYRDTANRTETLKKEGIHFIGCGISGGEHGALHGPSLMPGGSRIGWKHIRPLFETIAAKDTKGSPCVTYVGPGAAGHYVKMVHNGIEYGIMQLMAETYNLLRKTYHLSSPDIAKIFNTLNTGKLQSYLFESAVPILSQKDEKNENHYLIDAILDKANNKGTGKWTAIDALDRGIAIPTITEAVNARYISTDRKTRVALNNVFRHKNPKKQSKKVPIQILEDALYTAILSTFAQGFDLIQKASQEEGWHIKISEIARIWQGGCIIRAKLLDVLAIHLSSSKKHLFLVPAIAVLLKKNIPTLRTLVSKTTKTGMALPAFSASLWYFESMIETQLPANMIQGLRDYFGAHTYERIDIPGSFHTRWS